MFVVKFWGLFLFGVGVNFNFFESKLILVLFNGLFDRLIILGFIIFILFFVFVDIGCLDIFGFGLVCFFLKNND